MKSIAIALSLAWLALILAFDVLGSVFEAGFLP